MIDPYWAVGPPYVLGVQAVCSPSPPPSWPPLPGIVLVFEGDAVRVTDAVTLERLAGLYRTGGWPAQVGGDALTAPFSAPSASPPPWYLYCLTYTSVFGVAT